MKTALKATLWLAFGLEVISGIIWLLTIFYVLPAIPLIATIALLIVDIIIYRELNRAGKISSKYIKLHIILGTIIAGFFALIVYGIFNLDCIDVCTHPETYALTHTIPGVLVAFSIAMTLVLLPAFLNNKLSN